MLRSLTAAILLTAALWPAAASAQVVGEVNAANAEGKWGAEAGVGYALGFLPMVRITPMVGAFVGEADRPQLATPDGVIDLCKRADVSHVRCDDLKTRLYGRVEATLDLPMLPMIGAGVRFSEKTRPYGTVALPILTNHLMLKGNVGPDYYAVGLRASF